MSHSIVIFGASGDLTSRKLIPALYSLFAKDRLPEDTRIVGVSRSEFSHEEWRSSLAESTKKFVGSSFSEEAWQKFSQQIFYLAGDINTPADFDKLRDFLDEKESGDDCSRIYYLSTSPRLYSAAIANLGAAGLAKEDCGPRRVIIEKPFGVDRKTAEQLNADIHAVFQEDQVYRIDHYLGKETVQNMFVLRFANTIFEPLWNRNYVDHVQITVAEEVVVGSRAGYYDTAGVLRDMFQNHLLQLLMITAMEAPARFESTMVRDEKVKTLRAIRKLSVEDIARDTLRGQYDGYLQEKGAPPDSTTATYGAIKLHIDNWRWNGVPFYLRSGKAMSCRTTQIVIQFREPPVMMFRQANQRKIDANRLVIQIQPAEGIQLELQSKAPDAGMKLLTTDMELLFDREFDKAMPDAYQRLLLDCFNGDASLFARSDEVELAWGVIDPIQEAWQSGAGPELMTYPTGLWGPEASIDWLDQQGRNWFDVCPVLYSGK
ncbi:glucose-6-phosphate dehydrogenase [Lignipirellula cremea]|uniref:Glucose-6-phosphate 1-dehydrogenase n=1 Tax=Lignipirellula cremea TaxID=2528010 RepID=A0A518DX00_9BACT|nr:glucose-6-phosphate dehydrogenase [Lignipirellula cremea]QDU96368.1 Glucose-6-phosphate 1-dehydrogenase [Lignipirellula cremea]